MCIILDSCDCVVRNGHLHTIVTVTMKGALYACVKSIVCHFCRVLCLTVTVTPMNICNTFLRLPINRFMAMRHAHFETRSTRLHFIYTGALIFKYIFTYISLNAHKFVACSYNDVITFQREICVQVIRLHTNIQVYNKTCLPPRIQSRPQSTIPASQLIAITIIFSMAVWHMSVQGYMQFRIQCFSPRLVANHGQKTVLFNP